MLHIVESLVAIFLLHRNIYSGHDDDQSIISPAKQHRSAMTGKVQWFDFSPLLAMTIDHCCHAVNVAPGLSEFFSLQSNHRLHAWQEEGSYTGHAILWQRYLHKLEGGGWGE